MQYDLCVEKINKAIDRAIYRTTFNICIACKRCNTGCEWIDFKIPPNGSKYNKKLDSFKIKSCDEFIADYVRIGTDKIADAFGIARITYVRNMYRYNRILKELGYDVKIIRHMYSPSAIWIKRRDEK